MMSSTTDKIRALKATKIAVPRISSFGMKKGSYEKAMKEYNEMLRKAGETTEASFKLLGDTLVKNLSLERLLAIAMDTEESMPEEKFQTKADAADFFDEHEIFFPSWVGLTNIADSGKWWDQELELERLENEQRILADEPSSGEEDGRSRHGERGNRERGSYFEGWGRGQGRR